MAKDKEEKSDKKGKGKGEAPAAAEKGGKPEKAPKGEKGEKAEKAEKAPADAAAAPVEGAEAPKKEKKKKEPAAPGAEGAAAKPEGEAGAKKIYRRVEHAPSKRFVKDQEMLAEKVKEPQHLKAAVKLLKGTKPTKFDQTVECIIHLGIDPKQADQLIRGSLSLPHGIGKSKKVIVFCNEDQAEKAKAAGAIEAGLDALVKKVSEGFTDFDVAVATPDVMGKIARLGRVLGPQGKMPNPKSGTVSADVVGAVTEHSAGKIQYRNDAGGNVHGVVGKFSFSEEKLAENIHAFLDHIRRAKPSAAKGHYMRSAVIKGTMSPAVPLDLAHMNVAEE